MASREVGRGRRQIEVASTVAPAASAAPYVASFGDWLSFHQATRLSVEVALTIHLKQLHWRRRIQFEAILKNKYNA
jgi:hypothetical protein